MANYHASSPDTQHKCWHKLKIIRTNDVSHVVIYFYKFTNPCNPKAWHLATKLLVYLVCLLE